MKVLLFSSMLHDMNAGSPIRGRIIRDGLNKLGVDVEVVAPFSKKNIAKNEHDFRKYPSVEAAISSVAKKFSPDTIYAITHGLLNVVARAAKKNAVPFAVDLHGIRSVELFSERHSLKHFLSLQCAALRWEKALFDAKLITVANPMLYKWLSKIFSVAKPVIGIASDSFFSLQRSNASNKLRILYGGNLEKYQGVGVFLKALNSLDSSIRNCIEVGIVGTFGGDSSLHESILKSSSISCVSVFAPVPHDEFPKFISQFDVAIIPRPLSLATYFAFPQKLVDYMSAGLCVIASNIAPHRYAITHEKTGYLCDPTPESIAASIIKCLEGKKNVEIGQNGRRFALEHFSANLQCEKIVQYLHDIRTQ